MSIRGAKRELLQLSMDAEESRALDTNMRDDQPYLIIGQSVPGQLGDWILMGVCCNEETVV